MKTPKLVQLIRDNLGKTKPIRVEAAGGADEVTVYLYGVIGGFWGDIDAASFARELSAITASKVHLRINSPGGDVFEARAMMTAIAQHKATFIAHVDGIAASAATGICMSCDEVEITVGAMFMIHNAWTFAMGNKSDLRTTADLLEKIDAGLAQDYVAKTGKKVDEIQQLMDAETWFNAQEAVDNGFADRVVDTTDKSGDTEEASNAWNLSAYANAPKRAPTPPTDAAVAAHRKNLERRLALLERTAA